MNSDYHFEPPSSTVQRLLVVDQNLKDYQGHHHDYTCAIIKAAQKRGLSVQLVVNRGYRGAKLAGAPVVARCAGQGDGASLLMRAARNGLAQMPANMRRAILSRIPAKSGVARRPVRPDHSFAQQLLRIIGQQNLTNADHVLVHTLTESEFMGLSDVVAESALIAPQLHILLRYDYSDTCRDAFQTIAAVPHRISLWTDTEQLAAHYRALGCPAIHVLPILHGLDPTLRHKRALDAPLTLSFLGGARGDKGFQLLPTLVRILIDDPAYAGRIRFLIQTTFGFSREESLMAKTQCALKKFPRDIVTLIETPPDFESFQRALFSTDLMLLPYNPITYRHRSSGLLIQAMAAGIPTIVPDRSWLSDVVFSHAAVSFKNENDFVIAVKQAITNIDSLSEAALAAAPIAAARHDADNYIALLLEREADRKSCRE